MNIHSTCPVCDEPIVHGACPTSRSCNARLEWEDAARRDEPDTDDAPDESEDDA